VNGFDFRDTVRGNKRREEVNGDRLKEIFEHNKRTHSVEGEKGPIGNIFSKA
jgi:hypothetical protein